MRNPTKGQLEAAARHLALEVALTLSRHDSTPAERTYTLAEIRKHCPLAADLVVEKIVYIDTLARRKEERIDKAHAMAMLGVMFQNAELSRV